MLRIYLLLSSNYSILVVSACHLLITTLRSIGLIYGTHKSRMKKSNEMIFVAKFKNKILLKS